MSRSETSHSWIIIHRASTSFFANYALSRDILARISVESKLIPQSFCGISLVSHFCELLLLKSNLSLEFFMSLLDSCLGVLILWGCNSLPVRLILMFSCVTTVGYSWRSICSIGVAVSFLRLPCKWASISCIIRLRVVTFRRLS